jgi:hypothetical protein
LARVRVRVLAFSASATYVQLRGGSAKVAQCLYLHLSSQFKLLPVLISFMRIAPPSLSYIMHAVEQRKKMAPVFVFRAHVMPTRQTLRKRERIRKK